MDGKTALFIDLIHKYPDKIEVGQADILSPVGVREFGKELRGIIGPAVRSVRPTVSRLAEEYRQSLGDDALQGTCAIGLDERQKNQLFEELRRKKVELTEFQKNILKTSITF